MATSQIDFCGVQIHGHFQGLAHQLRSGTSFGTAVTLDWPFPQSWLGALQQYYGYGYALEQQHHFSWQKSSAAYPGGALENVLNFCPGELFWEVYGQGWVVDLHFGWDSTSGFQVFKKISLTRQQGEEAWTTVLIGKVDDLLKLSEKSGFKDSLVFKIVVVRESDRSTASALRLQNESDGLKKAMKQLNKAMEQLQSTIATLKQPSIDITRLVFHSRRLRSVKYLYVLSDLLTKFEYFQSCHSEEYSETHQQSSVQSDEQAEPSHEDLEYDDSDDEWDLEEEYTEKPNSTFRATIHVRGTSRRTYQAFIDYSLCGALYFAPPRSSWNSTLGFFRPPWPTWAQDHSTTHTNVPGIKTLTSAKSLYRMADMLMIPELKAICLAQIVKSFKVENVVDFICSPLFQQHIELRLEAYDFFRTNRDQVVKTAQFPRMIGQLSAEEAQLFCTKVFQ